MTIITLVIYDFGLSAVILIKMHQLTNFPQKALGREETQTQYCSNVMYHTGYKIRKIWLPKKSWTFSGPDTCTHYSVNFQFSKMWFMTPCQS